MEKEDICTNCGNYYDQEESNAERTDEFCKKSCEKEFNELSDVDFDVGEEIHED